MDSAQSLCSTYRHTQVSPPALIGLGLGLASQLRSLVRTARRRPRHVWRPAPAIAVLAALIWMLSALTVEITQGVLTVGFKGGLLQRTMALAAIRSVEQIEVPWYYGWGLRLTPGGWLYRAQGRHAVAVGLVTGKTVTIGTDEPAELAAAIEAARQEVAAAAA